MKKIASKDPVKLREKELSDGTKSLYLDIYTNGHRKYEFLHLYLVPGDGRKEKEKNRATMQLAETIRAKRLVEIIDGKYGFETDKTRMSFFDYFEQSNAGRSKCLEQQIRSTLLHMKDYTKGKDVKFYEVTASWLNGLRDHLLNTDNRKLESSSRKLSHNTAEMYYSKVLVCVKRAVRDGYITNNPIGAVERISREDTERKYLTIEELKSMAQTDCYSDTIKRAFMFSCLTGIRKSDVEQIRWKDVSRNGDFTRITFKQKKTRGQMYLDINDQAAQYMGEKGAIDEFVFGKFYDARTNTFIKAWAKAAGVNKEITFHSARHTFAILMLETGADIYVVKELLGHREIHTTEIYAKVVDKTRQSAVKKIPRLMDEDE